MDVHFVTSEGSDNPRVDVLEFEATSSSDAVQARVENGRLVVTGVSATGVGGDAAPATVTITAEDAGGLAATGDAKTVAIHVVAVPEIKLTAAELFATSYALGENRAASNM